MNRIRAAAALVFVGIACQRSKPVVRVDFADQAGPRPESAAGIDGALKAATRKELEQLSGFELRNPRGSELAYQMRVTVELIGQRPSERAGLIHRSVGVGLELWSLDRLVDVQVEALETADIPAETGYEALVESAVAETFRRLARALELRRASEKAILSALGSTDEAEVRAAMAAAGTRRLRSAVEPLSAIIRAPDTPTTVVLAAVGALVEIGDPEGAGAIIDAVDNQPPEFWPQIMFAVARLGGPTAEGFLFTVAQGHRDPRLRELARQAMDELKRSKPSPAP